MKCIYCNREIEDDSIFCKFCGGSVAGEGDTDKVRLCPNCSSQVSWGASFCKTCGAPLEKQGADLLPKTKIHQASAVPESLRKQKSKKPSIVPIVILVILLVISIISCTVTAGYYYYKNNDKAFVGQVPTIIAERGIKC
ncbi:MAG: zinc ribbon domain-containing protein [Clostridia bacterium]|nr:zinc ribbon domain-containing protein [Clostridia bacterium]